MILEVDNPLLIPQILKLAENIPETPLEKLKDMLISSINDAQAKILIEKKDDDIRGFLFSTIENLDGERAAFIQCCYIKPEAEGIGHELLTRIRNWAKENNLQNIYMLTKRDYKAYEKKYHFKLSYYLLKRGV
jgi:N-acetylglutamate synthase-like GNAT family acetyltransferase